MSIQLLDAINNHVPVNFKQFSGGERHVQLDELILKELSGVVSVQANLRCSHDVMDYLLLENILLNQGLTINLEIPYFPYARQDRICAFGQAFSLDVMTRLLNINAVHQKGKQGRVTVWDCHSEVTEALLASNTSFTEIINISSLEIIKQSPELVALLKEEKTVLICPDQGAKSRTQIIAHDFNDQRQQPIIVVQCDKKRNPETGKILGIQVNTSDLTGLTAVITDDICDGGATFIGIAQELRRLNCSKIILYVTHGIFSKGTHVFDGLIDRIFASNSLPQPPQNKVSIINFVAR
ncbi:phosphoribosyltransferase family protein [Acinetobacter rudis]|uniref:Ribose-phosphate pyrophosphokinase n=1 Tax=Acinetobacter rudis CIP 110305 TaxID=421052 RepID=S3P575_9GAMM|nr:phosphoribosyltransferase family protein [Acinetobacter rudis]EPF73991.1 ribose-phosphate pyrophosphokinase [Acinetobacter rudis CIP 110305]